MKRLLIMATITLGVTFAAYSPASAATCVLSKSAIAPATLGSWHNGGTDLVKNAKNISGRNPNVSVPSNEKTANSSAVVGSWASKESDSRECIAWFAIW